ncbi:MAG: hypothetical protein AAF268_05045 [Cyanobacteria bacterium P01_A01_bin.3]
MAKQLPLQKERLIEPDRVPEGVLLQDPGDRLSWGSSTFIIVWLAIWCGVSFPMFVVFLLAFIAEPMPATFFSVLFVSLFAVIGLVGIGWALRSLLVIAKLQPGEIVLPSYPLRLGESLNIRYRRQLRRGSISRPGSIRAKWLCYEWVQYRQGTSTRTVKHTLWETDLPERSVSAGTRRVEYDAQLHVNPHYPPSFDADSNQVRWELQVSVKLPGVPKDSSHFRLKIIPETV